MLTIWPSHEVFDAWIATPERDRLTASEVHQAVSYQPITRYGIAGGYLNHPGPGSRQARPRGSGGDVMKWVTRARPKTDRIACPWLIAKFIDPAAEILYVPASQVLDVARQQDAASFDAPGARYDHRDGQCTFEVLIDGYDLSGDPALMRLAKIVHAADIAADLDSDPAGPGRDCWRSASAGWTSKTTTTGCWNEAGSFTTLSTPGASARHPLLHDRHPRL